LHFKLPVMLRKCADTQRAPTTEPIRSQDLVTGWLGLLRRGVVAQAATPIIGAGRVAGIPICWWDFIVGNREQKLFPHFGEAGTAIFAVKQVEYGGHDRTLA
jgi:hypothetical protein